VTAPRPTRLDARALRDLVLDAGSWVSWDSPVPPRQVDDSYARELVAAAEKSREDESIITGEGRLRGRRVAVVAGEFGFLAGSIGVAAACHCWPLPSRAAPGCRRARSPSCR
jgi:acyl-CoA carboxylase subunit beta